MTFEELYRSVTKSKAQNLPIDLTEVEIDENHLSCLLHPDEQPLVWKIRDCDCTDHECVAACIFDAIEIEDGNVKVNAEKCVGCERCIEVCENQNFTFSRDTIKAIELLKESETPVYALVAPAFIGQFGAEVSPGMLRAAFKELGFGGMIEVALFADILTFKEALDFKAHSTQYHDFQLSSCCCPIWISMIKRNFSKIISHLPPSVSPMIACGRVIKALYPNAKTIFIGPCLAKKAEAKESDLVGAIDCVLTFQELADLFEAFQVDLSSMPDYQKEHASTAGRLYGRSGGVSEAVKLTAKRINLDCDIQAVQANGVKECKELLSRLLEDDVNGNFFEGMGCDGGCVGGPKRIISKEEGTRLVDEYANAANFHTPLDNPYAIELLKQLGFSSVEDFVKNSDILNRPL